MKIYKEIKETIKNKLTFVQNNKLEFPKGSFIKWCDEYFKIIDNWSDFSGTVMDMGGDVIRNFYFEYAGEQAELITDKNKIKELKSYVKSYQ